MKKGISLIVLVITIIVMIILAASVVITLSNTGVINRASQAVTLTDEKQVQDLAALVWAEAYLDETRTDTIEKAVKDRLKEQGVTDTDWNIEVSDTGVSVKKKGDAAIVSFKIGNNSLQAKEGMTWEEWCASDYNPFNENVQDKSYRCTVAGYVAPALGAKIVVYNGVEVTKTDVIIANAAYSLINV